MLLKFKQKKMNTSAAYLSTAKPLYEMWTGNNKFFNSGKIYAG